ncbi:MAG TPA: molybdate ABC transporter substrate-binding protein [Stellaceae bacterium]|nr:molybdate ABC transporter substrate-binding protein [Stellaceae bacterium]
MRRGWGVPAFAALLLLVAAMPRAYADYIVAPDVVVYCEPTLRPTLADIAEHWRRTGGAPVHLFSSPTPAMLEQIGHHARADLIIGEGEANADDAARRAIIKPETRHDLWRNRLVVAARKEGEGAPGDLKTLIGSGPIAIVDPPVGLAGADGRQALTALGLWPEVESHAAGVIDTADAVFLLRQHKAALAVVYATDVATTPGLSVAAPLPEDDYPPIRYWVAEAHNVLSPNTSAFAAFLLQPAAQEIARADSLEVLP